MYCEYCGAKQPEKNKFCTNCGGKMPVPVAAAAEEIPCETEPEAEVIPHAQEVPAAEPKQLPVEETPADIIPEQPEAVAPIPVVISAPEPEKPAAPKSQIPGEAPADHNPLYRKDTLMKWFHYLIKFGLIADGVIHILVGFVYGNGGRFTDPLVTEFMYANHPGLKIVDVVFCALMMALGVLMIVTRFQLAKFKKSGPTLLLISNLLDLILPGLSLLGLAMFVTPTEQEISTFVTTACFYAAAFFIHLSYFKKRKHLFVN